MTDRVDWRHIDERTFNQLVDALLVREYTGNGLIAMAIDGRGGDGGIDIDVTVEKTGQFVNIFQVKYFPEGFSGGHIRRRGQIKKSFDMAMSEHHPPVWTLVTPRKVSVQERKAVKDMRHGRIVRVRFVGPVELDVLLAKYPEIRDHFLADYAVKLLSAVSRTEAALAKAGDLESESRRIQKQLDGRSQYWGVSFGIAPDGSYVETLYAKRPDAPLREPLSVTLNAVFGPNHEDLRLQFQAGMDYGVSRPLTLPADVVMSFNKMGASWFEEELEGGELRLIPHQQAIGKTVHVVALKADGSRLAAISGTTSNIVSGAKGATVDVVLDGGLTQLWRFPRDISAAGQVTFEFQPPGHRARDVRSAIRFINALHDAERITIAIDGKPPIPMHLNSTLSPGITVPLATLVEDLAFIENELDVWLVLPEEGVSNTDRLWARIITRVLQGRVVPYPGIDGFNFLLTGEASPPMEGFLTTGGAIAVSNPAWSMSLLGSELFVGDVATFHPDVMAVDGSQHVAALRAGNGADRRVELEARTGLPFSFYSPSRLPKGRPVVTEEWGIVDAPEVGKLAELQSMQTEGQSTLPLDLPSLGAQIATSS
jgi:hypothetical protein